MLVGEQPGDKEDLAGKPFVGPAGQMLDRALEEAGIDRAKVYVTNAVKHFKFVPRGKIRLHQKPNTPEIKACRHWYERELAAIKPDLVVAMGATAAQSVFGKITPINKNRGRLIDLEDGTKALVTVHPSYLLRLPDAEAKAREYQRFVEDLELPRAHEKLARAACSHRKVNPIASARAPHQECGYDPIVHAVLDAAHASADALQASCPRTRSISIVGSMGCNAAWNAHRFQSL